MKGYDKCFAFYICGAPISCLVSVLFSECVIIMLTANYYLCGKQIKEGDVVTLLQPYYHHVDFSWKGKVRYHAFYLKIYDGIRIGIGRSMMEITKRPFQFFTLASLSYFLCSITNSSQCVRISQSKCL